MGSMEEQDQKVQEAISLARGQKRDDLDQSSSRREETPSGLKTKLMKMSSDLKYTREEVSRRVNAVRPSARACKDVAQLCRVGTCCVTRICF